jgi:uncharacterized protein
MDTSYEAASSSQEGLSSFMHGVYAWMCGGLIATAVIAYFVSVSPSLINIFITNIYVFYALLIAELIVVFCFSFIAQKVGTGIAAVLFLLYAFLNGLTFSLIFLFYTTSSIALTFLITAGMFGLLSIYGYMTKRDLTGVGDIALMALIGLILASVVNLFLDSSLIYWITTYAGIIIFTALTAYDTQKLKSLYVVGDNTPGGEKKEAIVGALTLYLDFINLFLFLLRIFGRSRE